MSSSRVTLEQLSAVLGRGERHGDWTLFFCPLHPDGEKHGHKGGRSLGFSTQGKLQCFAGCDPGEIARYVRDRLPKTEQKEEWRLVATYEYRDEQGELVAYKSRYHKDDPESKKGYQKRFLWRTPEGTYGQGLKEFGLTVADMPLYRAETIPFHDGPVWFVEGEECVHALERVGQVAVCPAGSASQVNFGGALEVLRGREVYLWPDNDEPGAKLAATVEQQLKQLGCKVVRIVAPVGPGEDAVDYFGHGGTIERLLEASKPQPVLQVLSPDHAIVTMPSSEGKVTFEFRHLMKSRRALDCELFTSLHDEDDQYWIRVNILSSTAREGLIRALKNNFGEIQPGWSKLVSHAFLLVRNAYFAANPVRAVSGQPDTPPADFIVDGLVVANGGSILFGPPGKGKSQTCMLLAVSIDAGLSDVFPVRRQSRVLYVNLERSEQSMAARLARVNATLGLDPDRPLLMLNARGKGLTDILERVREAIDAHGVSVVIVDSVSRSGLGDLNDNQVANAFVDSMNSLGVSWLGIAHTPRDDSSHIYGSVHQEAGADAMIRLTSESTDPTVVRVKLEVAKANDFRAAGEFNLTLRFNHDGLFACQSTSWVSVNDAYARVRDTLRKGARTPEELHKMLGIPLAAIESVLKREQFVRLGDGRYGVAARTG